MKKIIGLILLSTGLNAQTFLPLRNLERAAGAGSFVITNSVGVMTYTNNLPFGGGSSPAGLNSQIQFNGAGTFSASPNLTFTNSVFSTPSISTTATSTLAACRFNGSLTVIGSVSITSNLTASNTTVKAFTSSGLSTISNSVGARTGVFGDGANALDVFLGDKDGINGGHGIFIDNTNAEIYLSSNNNVIQGDLTVQSPFNTNVQGLTATSFALQNGSQGVGKYLISDASGVGTWTTAPGGGGGGSPAGSNGQIQFNGSGSFSATPNFSIANNALSLTGTLAVNSASLPTSSPSISVQFGTDKVLMGNIQKNQSPTFIEFTKGNGSGIPIGLRCGVGFLGTTEMNETVNMDYTTGDHLYYNSTLPASWSYLSHTADIFGIQYVPANNPNNSIYTNYGCRPFYVENINQPGTGRGINGFSKVHTANLRLHNSIDTPTSTGTGAEISNINGDVDILTGNGQSNFKMGLTGLQVIQSNSHLILDRIGSSPTVNSSLIFFKTGATFDSYFGTSRPNGTGIFAGASGNSLCFDSGVNDMFFGNDNTGIELKINGSNGFVGVNTTSPTANLHVAGTVSVTGASTLGNVTCSNVIANNANFNGFQANNITANASLVSSNLIDPSGYPDIVMNTSGGALRYLASNILSWGSSGVTAPIITGNTALSGNLAITGSVSATGNLTASNATLSATTINNTLTLADGINIAVGATTGSKFGLSTTDKIGFLGANPIVRPSAAADLGTVLSNFGLRAAAATYVLTTSGACSFGATTTRALSLSTAGDKITIKSGTNATIGTAILAAGTISVATTAVTANSKIFIQPRGITNAGFLGTAFTAATGFTVTSSNAADARTIDWLIIDGN